MLLRGYLTNIKFKIYAAVVPYWVRNPHEVRECPMDISGLWIYMGLLSQLIKKILQISGKNFPSFLPAPYYEK